MRKLPASLQAKRDEYCTNEIRKLRFSEFTLGYEACFRDIMESPEMKDMIQLVEKISPAWLPTTIRQERQKFLLTLKAWVENE